MPDMKLLIWVPTAPSLSIIPIMPKNLVVLFNRVRLNAGFYSADRVWGHVLLPTK